LCRSARKSEPQAAEHLSGSANANYATATSHPKQKSGVPHESTCAGDCAWSFVPFCRNRQYLPDRRGSLPLCDCRRRHARLRRIPFAKVVESRFGAGAAPLYIALTHGHVDHAGFRSGAGKALAHPPSTRIAWKLPFITGKSGLSSTRPNRGRRHSLLGRFFPNRKVNLNGMVHALDDNFARHGWLARFTTLRVILRDTSHFFRPSDRTLLAGDAFTTVDLDSFGSMATQEARGLAFHRRPLPAIGKRHTNRWNVSPTSRLACSRPDTALPMSGPESWRAAASASRAVSHS